MRPRALTTTVAVALGLLAATTTMACQTAESDDASGASAQTDLGGASLYRAGNRFVERGGPHDTFLDEVQPILGKRCVTCHGCSTSPCNLKLTSFEGADRGANAQNYFAQTVRAHATGPLRMKDATSTADFRKKGFYSVTEGGRDSIMYKLLEHGKGNEAGFDLKNAYKLYDEKVSALDYQCVDTRKELDDRIATQGMGMPFGLTKLPDAESRVLADWLAAGAKGPSPEAQAALEAPRDPAAVQEWEDFLNQDSPKAKTAARYVFEHVFFARLHIDDSATSKGDFFELVRSSTKTGPVREIVTERPSDDPKAPFFYRLKRHTQLVTAKDHTVVHLDGDVRARWKQLLWDAPFTIDRAPGYSGLNPFEYFEKVPGKYRYQFMLEMSQTLIEAMVKGDVCNGSGATYAIRDRFFTLFLKPDSDPSAIDPGLGSRFFWALDPTSSSLFKDRAFEEAFEAKLRELRPNGLSVEDLWDGGKKDENAWVTVFRHHDNASAHKGPMGQFPETAWVLDYGNFERLYYDLVVLYRPWAAVTHKLNTWRTMSHVRAHGEDLFLLFLPEDKRDALRLQFTPGLARWTETPMRGAGFPSATAGLDANRPMEDFVGRVRRYLGSEIAGATRLDPDPMAAPATPKDDPQSRDDIEDALLTLTQDRGKISDAFPDVTWVTIEGGSQPLAYTVLANRIFWSNTRVIGDSLPSLARRPELDSMSVVRGHIGAFPELFLRVPAAEMASVVLAARASKEQRVELRRKFEVKRNTPDFWRFLEAEHARQLVENPFDAGILDTRRYVYPLDVNPIR